MTATPRRWPTVIAVFAGLIALAVGWRTLEGSFVSDDFLLASLYTEDCTGTNWGQVFADFGRSWFGVPDSHLWRPLLTTSFGVDIALSGSDPRGFHWTNLLLHVIAVMANAVIAATLVRRSSRLMPLAALCCGAFTATHPIVIESVAWIAARNSGIEVAFRNLALACFTLALAGDRRALRIAAIGFGACALACKESAVMLLPAAVAIDLIDSPLRSLRNRLRLHLPFLLLLAGYFLLRTALFGTPIGTPGSSASSLSPLPIGLNKLGATFWPAHGPIGFGALGMIGLIALYLIALAGVRYRPMALVATAGWVLASVAPTWSLELKAAFAGSRMMLGTLHGLGVGLAVLALGRATDAKLGPRQFAAGLTFLVTAAAMLSGPTHHRLAAFEQAWQVVDQTIVDLQALEPDTSTERPVALFYLPEILSTPPLNPNAWFPLAQRPLQPNNDLPLVSIGCITWPGVPGSESLWHDPSPVRALWQHGSVLVSWSDQNRELNRMPPPSPAAIALDAETVTREEDGSYRFATPRPIFGFDGFVCTGPEAATVSGSATLILDPSLPMTPELTELVTVPLREGVADFTHAMGTFALAAAGGAKAHTSLVRGVKLKGSDPASLEVLGNRPRLALPETLGGAEVPLASLSTRFRPPNASAPLRMIVLTPHTVLEFAVNPDSGHLVIPLGRQRDLELIQSVSRVDTLWYYFETLPPAAPSRTPIDFFTMR